MGTDLWEPQQRKEVKINTRLRNSECTVRQVDIQVAFFLFFPKYLFSYMGLFFFSGRLVLGREPLIDSKSNRSNRPIAQNRPVTCNLL